MVNTLHQRKNIQYYADKQSPVSLPVENPLVRTTAYAAADPTDYLTSGITDADMPISMKCVPGGIPSQEACFPAAVSGKGKVHSRGKRQSGIENGDCPVFPYYYRQGTLRTMQHVPVKKTPPR